MKTMMVLCTTHTCVVRKSHSTCVMFFVFAHWWFCLQGAAPAAAVVAASRARGEPADPAAHVALLRAGNVSFVVRAENKETFEKKKNGRTI